MPFHPDQIIGIASTALHFQALAADLNRRNAKSALTTVTKLLSGVAVSFSFMSEILY